MTEQENMIGLVTTDKTSDHDFTEQNLILNFLLSTAANYY